MFISRNLYTYFNEFFFVVDYRVFILLYSYNINSVKFNPKILIINNH